MIRMCSEAAFERSTKTVERRDESPRPKKGFTLMELLVVLSIVGMLMSLLLPAVQQSRENARATQCANHLRQVGLALANLDNAHGVLPCNGGWDGKQQIKSITGQDFTPTTVDLPSGIINRWGVGDPTRGVRHQTGSWAYCILLYVERRDLFNANDAWTIPVGGYLCPSRRGLAAFGVVAQDTYGKYEGGGWSWGKIDYAANHMIVGQTKHFWQLAEVTDGTSQTILAGEKAFDAALESDWSWYWDEPFFLGGSGGTARSGPRVLIDGCGDAIKGNWGSAHPAGAHFLFLDGSVRVLPYDVPWNRLLAYLTPREHETLGDL